jgi:two-component system OmpR family response regulator
MISDRLSSLFVVRALACPRTAQVFDAYSDRLKPKPKLGPEDFVGSPAFPLLKNASQCDASSDRLKPELQTESLEVMRVLVVEDDKKIASFVVNGLKQSGFAVDHAANGEDGLIMARSVTYDAAVIDIMLPKLDGLSLVQTLRREGVRTPVIILSAKASVDDRVRGLQAGGDDYLTKPFAFSELLARVQALIRRSTQTVEPTRLTIGDLTLDLLTREVTRGKEKIELQAREFALLEYLMRNAGRVVTKTMILEHIWDYSFDPQTNVVDVLVHRLRSKVDRDRTLIHTTRGVGYVLKAP